MDYSTRTLIYAGYKEQRKFKLIGETEDLTPDETVDALVNTNIARCKRATVRDYDIIAFLFNAYDQIEVYYKEKLPWED